jgi:hypothetical protein
MDSKKQFMERVTTVRNNVGDGMCETVVTTETGHAEGPETIVERTIKKFELNRGWGHYPGTYKDSRIWGVTLGEKAACAKTMAQATGSGQYGPVVPSGLSGRVFGQYEGNDYLVIHHTHRQSRFVDLANTKYGERCRIETSDSEPATAHVISEMLYYRRKWAREAAIETANNN